MNLSNRLLANAGKLLWLFGVFALGCGSTARAQQGPATSPRVPAETIQLRIVGGLDGVNQYTRHEVPFWTETLKRRSNGRVVAEIAPFDRAGILANESLRLIQLGVLPFGTVLLTQAVGFAPELVAPDLAGLNPDLPSVRKAVASFRPFMEQTLRERYGIELLAIYAYPAQVLFCRKQLNKLSDINGLTVRTSSPSQTDFVEALGAKPIAIPFGKIVERLRGGQLDCVITGSMSGNTIRLHEQTSYLYSMPLNWGLSIFVANGQSWRHLPIDVQQLLKEELPKLEAAIWLESERESQAGIECNTGMPACTNGQRGAMQLVNANAADQRKRAEVFQKDVLSNWARRCGAKCVEAWEANLAKTTGVEILK